MLLEDFKASWWIFFLQPLVRLAGGTQPTQWWRPLPADGHHRTAAGRVYRCATATVEQCFGENGYGSIPTNTIFSGMNIHLPAILMWTEGVQGFDTLPNGVQNQGILGCHRSSSSLTARRTAGKLWSYEDPGLLKWVYSSLIDSWLVVFICLGGSPNINGSPRALVAGCIHMFFGLPGMITQVTKVPNGCAQPPSSWCSNQWGLHYRFLGSKVWLVWHMRTWRPLFVDEFLVFQVKCYLVVGLEHFLFSHILGIIIPTD